MHKLCSLLSVALLAFSVASCTPKKPPLDETLPLEPVLSDTTPISDNPLIGCWCSPQDTTAGQLCFYEDSVLFTDLLMFYPYYTKGDSLIVNSTEGDVFIRWRYVRQHDTLMLFHCPEGNPEEYLVLMTLCRE